MSLEKSDKSKNPKKVYLADKYICNYISEELFDSKLSLRELGRIHGIHQHVVSKINQTNGYKIPFSTVIIICFYRGIELSSFLKSLEKKYDQKLDDSYIEE
ncbi:hypothetical protein [Gelidibacter mesophilus]|uniref:hypothetical protein n=1 Tax=Gelidibacter mesophilus TaxID=169050 RepID=UPI0003FE1A9A|nr:hypothetical protein [Gelidibacter mesophilus]